MKTTCITKTDLSQFLHGQLASERLTQVAAHVDDCQECQDTVVALAGEDDTFVGSLQAAQVEGPYEQEAALRQGIRRLVSSLRRFSFAPDPEATAAYVYQIGPYVLEEALGSGGMGTVYRAVHSKLKRNVAVKLLPEARWSNVAAITRFEREMEAIGQLDHPNIVRASDAGEDQGMHYLVMDYVEGLDLSRLSNRLGPLPVADACELARQAALGLQYVHENGLVHRDIKPSNLMLAWNRAGGSSSIARLPQETNTREASLRILDLGLALLGDEHLEDAHELTSVGQLMGTLDYMSPETRHRQSWRRSSHRHLRVGRDSFQVTDRTRPLCGPTVRFVDEENDGARDKSGSLDRKDSQRLAQAARRNRRSDVGS